MRQSNKWIVPEETDPYAWQEEEYERGSPIPHKVGMVGRRQGLAEQRISDHICVYLNGSTLVSDWKAAMVYARR